MNGNPPQKPKKRSMSFGHASFIGIKSEFISSAKNSKKKKHEF